MTATTDTKNMAVFCDFENVALGVREAAITRAEGDKQAAILEAQGQSEAIQRLADAEKYREAAVAEGEASATRAVFSAIHDGNPTPDLLALKYLEALRVVANGQATKIFLPTEMSGLFGAVGGLAELLHEPSADGEKRADTEPAEQG